MKDYFWQCSPILISDISVGIYRSKIFKYYGIFNSKKYAAFIAWFIARMYQILPWSATPRLPHTSSWPRSGPPPDRAAPWSPHDPNQADPDWRLSKNIISKKYLKRRKLLLINVFCGSTFILFSTGTLHLLVYISE